MGLRNGTCVKSILSGHCMKNSRLWRTIFARQLMHSYFFQNISGKDAWNKLPFESDRTILCVQYNIFSDANYVEKHFSMKHHLFGIT